MTNDSAFVFGLALPLPLFDRNQGGIAEAVANLATARQRYEAVRVETLTGLSEAAAALAASQDEATALRNEALPAAQQAFEAVRQDYLQGKLDCLHVVDVQGELFKLQARFIDSIEAYHKARADIERLTGRALNPASRTPIQEDLNEK
ncbi:MAG: TolC family protein [Sedimentisphaerales bacterium]|nr:TolC family protein [Sedimentisphaerales bacterium]